MYLHILSILTHTPTTRIHTYHTYSHTLTTGEFVLGRVIRAMSQCWHPKCFKCVSCHTELADVGFVKNQGRYATTLCQLYHTPPQSPFKIAWPHYNWAHSQTVLPIHSNWAHSQHVSLDLGFQ